MVISCANPTTNAVCQTKLGANVRYQPRGKAAAKKLVEDLNGIVVGIAPLDAQSHHVAIALVDVVFLDQEQTLRRMESITRRMQACRLRESARCVAECRLH